MPFPDRDYPDAFPEGILNIPWVINPINSWIDYVAWVEVELDSGFALHKILPQRQDVEDSLGSIDCQDSFIDRKNTITGGVNFASFSSGADLIQRMSTSTYRFVLKGHALRIGYQVTIPVLTSVGGNPVVSEGKQKAYNQLVGNFSGIPMWYAQWELAYMIPSPNSSSSKVGNPQPVPIPFNPALHIRSDAQLPALIGLPWTETDDNRLQ